MRTSATPLPLRSVVLGPLLAFASSGSMAADRILPTLEISAVLIEVTWVVDSLELAGIRERYESPAVHRSRSSTSVRGFRNRATDGVRAFSVLGKRNGEWVCQIFVERPAFVNDSHTLHLGHELTHCLFGAYH